MLCQRSITINMISQCVCQSTFFGASRSAYKKQDDRLSANKITSCVSEQIQGSLDIRSIDYIYIALVSIPFFLRPLQVKPVVQLSEKRTIKSACKGIHSL